MLPYLLKYILINSLEIVGSRHQATHGNVNGEEKSVAIGKHMILINIIGLPHQATLGNINNEEEKVANSNNMNMAKEAVTNEKPNCEES